MSRVFYTEQELHYYQFHRPNAVQATDEGNFLTSVFCGYGPFVLEGSP